MAVRLGLELAPDGAGVESIGAMILCVAAAAAAASRPGRQVDRTHKRSQLDNWHSHLIEPLRLSTHLRQSENCPLALYNTQLSWLRLASFFFVATKSANDASQWNRKKPKQPQLLIVNVKQRRRRQASSVGNGEAVDDIPVIVVVVVVVVSGRGG